MMSEQTCPKCGKPLDQCECEERVTEVIKVKHEGLGVRDQLKGTGETVSKEEYEDVKARAEEAEKIIEAQAIVEFDKQKKEFLNLIEDEDKRKQAEQWIGEDPDRLQNAMEMTDILVKSLGVGGVKVKGSEEYEQIRKPTQSGVPYRGTDYHGSSREAEAKLKIKELYGIVKNPQASNEEKLEANRRLDEIWGTVVKGFRAGRGTPRISLSICPQCGITLGADADECFQCGWKKIEKVKTGRKI